METEHGFSIQIKLLPSHVIEIKLQQAIQTAKKLFLSDPKKSTPAYEEWQKDSYHFLKACIISLLQLDDNESFSFDATKKMEVDGHQQTAHTPTKIPSFVQVFFFVHFPFLL